MAERPQPPSDAPYPPEGGMVMLALAVGKLQAEMAELRQLVGTLTAPVLTTYASQITPKVAAVINHLSGKDADLNRHLRSVVMELLALQPDASEADQISMLTRGGNRPDRGRE